MFREVCLECRIGLLCFSFNNEVIFFIVECAVFVVIPPEPAELPDPVEFPMEIVTSPPEATVWVVVFPKPMTPAS
jgi:hypothetical protein